MAEEIPFLAASGPANAPTSLPAAPARPFDPHTELVVAPPPAREQPWSRARNRTGAGRPERV